MFIDVNHEHMHAITLQQIAAVRQRWAMEDRGDYMVETVEFGGCGSAPRNSFIQWSAERAEYARAAMKEMGVTDKDQYYA